MNHVSELFEELEVEVFKTNTIGRNFSSGNHRIHRACEHSSCMIGRFCMNLYRRSTKSMVIPINQGTSLKEQCLNSISFAISGARASTKFSLRSAHSFWFIVQLCCSAMFIKVVHNLSSLFSDSILLCVTELSIGNFQL